MNDRICYDNPAQIDGPPSTVRQLALLNLRDAALAFGELLETTLGQVRSADVGDMLEDDLPTDYDYKLAWAKSPRGEAADRLRRATSEVLRATADLGQKSF